MVLAGVFAGSGADCDAFAKLKLLVRRAAARTKATLLDAIAVALTHITATDAKGFSLQCGYAIKDVPDLLSCSPL